MAETNLFKALELSEPLQLVDIDPHTKTSKLVDPVKESKVKGLPDTITVIPTIGEFKDKNEKVKVEPRVISEMARFTIEEVEALTRGSDRSILKQDIDKRTKMLLDVFNRNNSSMPQMSSMSSMSSMGRNTDQDKIRDKCMEMFPPNRQIK